MKPNMYFNKSFRSFSSFSVPVSSLFWFHLSVGVPLKSKTYNHLNGLDYPAVVYSSATVYPQDQLCTDTLQWVRPNVTLSVSNEHSLFSSPNLETSWLGFRLDNLFNPLRAFGVQQTKTSTFVNSVVFDRILVNEGNSYKASDEMFVAPLNGIYFFTVTTSSFLYLVVNKLHIMLTICLCDNVHGSDDIVTSRGSIMLTLNANDIVQVVPHNKLQQIVTNHDGVTNFYGFLYSPVLKNQVAWSVARTSSVVGPSDNVAFDIINVNEPNCWIAALHYVVIPHSGMYYVDICAYLCGVFHYCQGDGNAAMQVLRNGKPIMLIGLINATFVNCVSRSRSIIINLNMGDKLRVTIPTKGCCYSDKSRMITFNGFLLN